MTVGIIIPQISYAFTGPAVFDFHFRALEEEHILVQHRAQDGSVTVLIYQQDYTVTLNPLTVPGGTVDVSWALATTGTLTISRDIPIDQQTDYVNNDPFDMEILERSLDKLTMICQQLEFTIDEGLVQSAYVGVWQQATQYETNDIVQYPDQFGNYYSATQLHVSGTDFNADLAAGNWQIFFDIGAIAGYAATAQAASAEATLQAAEAVAQAGNALASANSATSSALASQQAQAFAETARDDAQIAEIGAETARDIAYLWAQENEDVTVNDGVHPVGHSAYHWAQKASGVSPAGRMQWRGDWVAGSYDANDVVRDGDWVMVALVTTTDRPGPQVQGLPFSLYDGPEAATTKAGTNVVIGITYDNPASYMLRGIRIYTFAGMHYDVSLVRDPSGSPSEEALISFDSLIDGWQYIPIAPRFMAAGEEILLYADVSDAGGVIDIIEDVGLWNAAAGGLISIGGTWDLGSATDDGYGIDLAIQLTNFSNAWDLVAYNGISMGGGGGGGDLSRIKTLGVYGSPTVAWDYATHPDGFYAGISANTVFSIVNPPTLASGSILETVECSIQVYDTVGGLVLTWPSNWINAPGGITAPGSIVFNIRIEGSFVYCGGAVVRYD